MAWFADSHERLAWILRNGLPVIIEEARVQADGFVALYLRADDAVLPRSNVSRGWELHVALGYTSDYPEGTADSFCELISARWAGRFHVLDIEWIGKGGAVMIRAADPIAEDPFVKWLHSHGWYGNGLHTEPRQLHVSL